MTAPVSLEIELGLTAESGAFILDASLLDGPATLGGDLGFVWTTVTDWVIGEASFDRTASAQGPYTRYQGGRCSFVLDSLDGRFDPTNLASPYVAAGITQLRPGVPIRIVARAAGSADQVLWSGRCDDWPVVFNGEFDATVSITGSDAVETLQAANLPELSPPVGAGETASNRIHRILDRHGWPAGQRVIADLPTTLQPSTLAQPAWTDILLTADSAGADAWIDAEGKVVVRPRLAFPNGAQATVGMTPSALPVESIMPDTAPRSRVINSVALGAAGSTAQFVEDLDSVARFGRRSWGRTDLLCADDADVMALATQVIAHFASLRPWQPVQVAFALDGHAATWGACLSRDIGDRVAVTQVTPDGRTITAEALIASVAWRWAPAVGRFAVTWGLASLPPNFTPFVLDVSLLDVHQLALV